MADLVIRGMNMPKSCDECRLFNESWCMALGVENWRKSYNKPPEGGRLPDCPLVPLPEGHGKLGDLDKLYTIANERSMGTYGPVNYMCVITGEDILKAPILVPAEGDSKK